MNHTIRVRFAPSPTGALHIGGIRTALYNYLFAKKHKGVFVLRIEDTDQNRFVPGAESYIIESLKWCGIPFDEGPGLPGNYGPYRQSERKHLYKAYAEQLVTSGNAYYAFDTTDSLEKHRKTHEEKGKTFIYNWHNRQKLDNSLTLTEHETTQRLASGVDYVIRFKSPKDEKLHLTDIIRGSMEIDTNVLDDKVLFKSDGMPTYHLANIVDDHLMEISHVIRGEEWLPSLALHYLLYRAFDWRPPAFAHLPLLLKPTGKGKLSKRDGEIMGFPVFPLQWENTKGYREEGYFPETVVNFLALLGWNPGTEQEIFSLPELTDSFSLERVQKSGARFDIEKTKWYNQYYLQQKSNDELTRLFLPLLKQALLQQQNPVCFNIDEPTAIQQISKIIALVKDRATFVKEFWDLSSYFFVTPLSYDSNAVSKQWKPNTPQVISELLSLLEAVEPYTADFLETTLKQWISEKGYSFGQLIPPLRLVIVGEMKGPYLFNILELIGKKETLIRIKNALQHLN
ncbi:glutamate--tRNA ligase [Arenibacter sp. GZD96]|uniref:glutamate--tRNA ligase n=1 Tax=Aurantibrevibacter litoralis TaxID=3106030 RepID=UPI002AFEA364|nr:glutamate--tRNA ligase [Arenibacter sp. GZD-96]MEA1786471.1 glutamate--tRNA ligase [Arenibacter sp. GZD-96]